MFVKMPLSSAEVLLKGARLVWAVASMREVNSTLLARETHAPVRSARLLIKKLVRCELLSEANGAHVFTGKTVDGCLVLNLRDEMLDALFRRKATRATLLCLARGERSTKGIAEKLSISRRTVIRAIQDLRAAGVVRDKEVVSELLCKPDDPLEEVPRSVHRRAVAHFKRCFETYSIRGAPLILFGEAARGNYYATLKLAALLRFNRPDEIAPVVEALLRSAEETTEEYNVPVSLYLVPEDAWYAQRFKLVKTPLPTLLEVLDGIFIYGAPPKDENYFELIRQYYQPPQEVIEKMLEKRHIRPYDNGFSFTEEGLKAWRRKPIEIAEFEYTFKGKKISVISPLRTYSV